MVCYFHPPQQVTFFGSRFIDDRWPVVGREVAIEGMGKPAVVNNDGMYLVGSDGKKVQYCTCNCIVHMIKLILIQS